MSKQKQIMKKFFPKTKALLDSLKNKPTDTQRIEALEQAVAELAIQQAMMEVSE